MATLTTPSPKIFSNLREHANKATGRVSFEIQGVDLSVVNGIRRTLLTDIPTVGLIFEKGQGFLLDKDGYRLFTVEPSMEIEVNTGPLHNEFLLHRLSMIPIYLSEEEVESYEPNTLMFEIQKTNKTPHTIPLTTHDIVLMKNNEVIPPVTVKTYLPVNAWSKEPILITRLRPNESMHIYGSFVKSTARANAGMSPVSLCSYMPKLDTDKIKQEKIRDVLERERTFLKNDYGDPIAWTFEVESENGLSVPYLVDKALDILVHKVNRAKETLLSDALAVKAMEPAGTFEYAFQDEDDTLGNLIQGYIHNHYYRTESLIDHRFRLSFVGYCCPHPLETKMNVRLTLRPPSEERTDITEDSVTEMAVRDFFKQCLDELKHHLISVRTEWCHFTNRPEPSASSASSEPSASSNPPFSYPSSLPSLEEATPPASSEKIKKFEVNIENTDETNVPPSVPLKKKNPKRPLKNP